MGGFLRTGGPSTVVLNVTAVGATASGYVTAYPAGQPLPNASNLNITPGRVVPNLVVVPVGTGGVVNLFTSVGTDFLVDILGSFTPGTAPDSTSGLFVPIKPARVRDTRFGYPDELRPFGQESVEVPIRDRAGIPLAGVSGVLLNVTGVQSGSSGCVTAFASEDAIPISSNLNLDGPDQTVGNAAVVKVGTSWVSLYTYGAVHLIADAFGYFVA